MIAFEAKRLENSKKLASSQESCPPKQILSKRARKQLSKIKGDASLDEETKREMIEELRSSKKRQKTSEEQSQFFLSN